MRGDFQGIAMHPDSTLPIVLMSRTFWYRSLPRQPRRLHGNHLRQRVIRLVRGLGPGRKSGGYSLIVVFLLVMTILTTSLALTSRATSGLYGQSFQSKLRLAKDAAENGLTIVASDLNYPGNRVLMGGYTYSEWSTGVILTTDSNPPKYAVTVIPSPSNAPASSGRPCYVYSSAGSARSDGVTDKKVIYYPTDSFKNIFKGQSSDRYYIGNGQSYQPVKANFYDSNHIAADPATKAANNDISYLAIVVEGAYNPSLLDGTTYNIGAILPTTGSSSIDISKDVKYAIQQEFQVVPRCCSKGFGSVSGTSYGPVPSSSDSSSCPATTQAEWIVRSVSRTSTFNTTP